MHAGSLGGVQGGHGGILPASLTRFWQTFSASEAVLSKHSVIFSDTPSTEDAEAEDSEVDSSVTRAEVTEEVWTLLGGKDGVDQIRPEHLESWMLWGCLG